MHHSAAVNHPNSATRRSNFPAAIRFVAEPARFPRYIAQCYSEKGWPMLRHVGWATTAAAVAIMFWQTTAEQPMLPRLVWCSALALVSGLAGLRIGADSAARYTKDLVRLNKTICDQNRDLEEMNAMLLNEVNSHSQISSDN
jgi:hypothetical protein